MDATVLFAGEELAQYILQVSVLYNKDNAKMGMIHGSFIVWHKQGQLGSADEVMFFCPKYGCTGIIENPVPELTPEEEDLIEDKVHEPHNWPLDVKRKYVQWIRGTTTCPKCHGTFPREELSDAYGFRMPISDVAARMEELFSSLHRNADVLMVIAKSPQGFLDAKKELESTDFKLDAYKKKLDTARDRTYVRYSLENIMKDTAAGTTVQSRFEALLRA